MYQFTHNTPNTHQRGSMSFTVVVKRCISHYFRNGTDTRVPQNVFLVVIIISIIIIILPSVNIIP